MPSLFEMRGPDTGIYLLNPADFPGAGLAQVFTSGNYLDDYRTGDRGTQAVWDAEQNAPKLTMPSESPANGSGDWSWFNVHSATESIQSMSVRLRVNQEFIDGASASYGQSFPKLFTLWRGSGSNAIGDSLVAVNTQFRGGFAAYTNVGSGKLERVVPSPDFWDLQPGGDTSWSYGLLPAHSPIVGGSIGPFPFRLNEWFTVVLLITLDTVTQANNVVEGYARYDTGAWSDQWYKIFDINMTETYPSSSPMNELSSLQLTLYMTDKPSTLVHNPITCHYNYVLYTAAHSHAHVKSKYGIQ